eukprot:15347098-Ditylum_brightwellii.AAC.1
MTTQHTFAGIEATEELGVLYFKVAQWCKMLSLLPPRIPTDSTGLKLYNAVETQYDLGWNNFMKGRIAKQWCTTQATSCCSFPKPKDFDDRQWTTKLIKAIWTLFIDIWTARNAHLHTDMENQTTNILDNQ